MKLHPLIVLVVVLSLEGTSQAHSPGVSQSDFFVESDGKVDARIVLAARETFKSMTLDRDHDGVVTGDELAAAQPDLRAFLEKGIAVDADDAPCPVHFKEAAIAQDDALVLDATYDCPRDASTLAITLFFLSELGPTHRDDVHVASGDRELRRTLTGSDRYVALELAPPKQKPRLRHEKAVIALTAAFAAFFVGLFVWRWRATRKRPKT